MPNRAVSNGPSGVVVRKALAVSVTLAAWPAAQLPLLAEVESRLLLVLKGVLPPMPASLKLAGVLRSSRAKLPK